MSSKPDPMEALKIMTDYLSQIEKHQDPSVYFRCAAMCSGLAAIVYELQAIKEVLAAKPH
jgi:hypothetical protein